MSDPSPSEPASSSEEPKNNARPHGEESAAPELGAGEASPTNAASEEEADDEQDSARLPAEVNLPAEIAEEVEEIVGPDQAPRVLGVLSQYYRGPIPPAVLESYERLAPGFAREYLNTIPAEIAHRHQLDNRQVVTERIQIIAPLTYGFVYVFLLFVFGAWLAYTFNRPDIAATMIGAVAVGGIIAFVTQRRETPPSDTTDAADQE